jgi:hypothetical protein
VTRRALSLVSAVLFAFVISLPAQQQPAPPADAPQSTVPGKMSKQQKDAAANTEAFDERAAAQVLGTIRDGLEGHSQRRLLSAFDSKTMDGYLTFEDQIDAYFTRYESFRVTYRILQTSEENERGVILAEFHLESSPRGGGTVAFREGQLRFELQRGPKGWKIVDFDPRGFFS